MTKIEQKIPEGWSIKKLKDITILLTNGFVGTASIHYSDAPDGVIYIQGFNITKGGFNLTGIKKVTQEFHLKNKKSSLKYGDLLTIQTGDIGITAMVQASMEGSNCHALIISRFDKSICFPPYFLHLYNSDLCQRVFKTIETGSTMKHLNVGDMAELKLLFPPLPEQEKIAGILSCWDDGIEKLSALIEKKKIQRKALMQQLLTGKHRLKGFPAPWHEVRLGNIGTTYTGLSGKDKESFGHGKPYIPYLNIYQNFVIDTNQFELVAIADGENQNTVKYGDIFFTTSSETPDEVGISSVLLEEPKEETYLNSFCFGFRLHDFSILLPFYAAYLCRSEQIRKTMYMLAQGATRFNLPKTEFLKSYIYIPSDIAEQKAIAEILSKADEEIELLNKKLEAFKQEKKALMQQLLTGKIRVKVN